MSAQNLAAGLQGWAIWAIEAIFPLLFHKPEAGLNFMVNSREKKKPQQQYIQSRETKSSEPGVEVETKRKKNGGNKTYLVIEI